jgi:tetratricopeptide (TPR) repeat protein
LGNYRLGIQYATLGRHEDAIATFKKVGNWMGKENLQAAIAHVYALQGRRREALQMITAVRAKANPYGIVRVYDALGDKNEAFRILDKAVEEHRVRAVRDDPLFENLHADPRWEQLLHRMNLPSADPAGQ